MMTVRARRARTVTAFAVCFLPEELPAWSKLPAGSFSARKRMAHCFAHITRGHPLRGVLLFGFRALVVYPGREILTSSAGNGSNGVILGNFRFVFCYHYRLPGRDVSDPFNRLMRIPRILLHSHQIIQRII